MNTTTARLTGEAQHLLNKLSPEHGAPPEVILQALRMFAEDKRRETAFREFMAAWEAEEGPLDPEEVSAMAKRYGL